MERRKLPIDRAAITHEFEVAGYGGRITVGLYDNGDPGEIFIELAKAGTAMSGFSDAVALLVSMALQRGVPLGALIDKFSGTRFEPQGHSSNPQIGYATSVLDYIFRYLELRFPKAAAQGREGGGSGGGSQRTAPACRCQRLEDSR